MTLGDALVPAPCFARAGIKPIGLKCIASFARAVPARMVEPDQRVPCFVEFTYDDASTVVYVLAFSPSLSQVLDTERGVNRGERTGMRCVGSSLKRLYARLQPGGRELRN